ncbi:MAG TPA: carbohydrate ABC transporter permease [Anaerolineales bacterium]|nr:carbohydrate ABC transporter permease [Anaerolineales bacterium]
MSALRRPTDHGIVPLIIRERKGFKLFPFLWKILLYLVLLVGAAITLFPLFWMISTSFKTEAESNASRIIWLPHQVQLDAYKAILANKDFLIAYANSIFVTIIALLGTVITIALVAYAFSRIEWPGRNLVFFLMLSTMMIPTQSLAVPQYMIFLKFKWVGTFNPIVIPGFFAGGAAMIFLLRQFMAQIPKELDEAALMDGATHLQIWYYVIMPLCRPAIATISAILFVGIWNSLLYPLIFLTSTKLYTLPIFVTTLYNPQMPSQPWPTIMSASVLTALPLLIIFFFAQRYLIESIVLTGSKG